MDSSIKFVFSIVAILLTFAAFFPYIRSILRGTTKPHLFSWVIWGTTTLIVFFAQLKAKGGMGAWPIGISGTITTYIALLAFLKSSQISITRTDWLFFIAALSSLPFWYFTSNPFWAVLLLTLVDLLGFGPTIRKAYACPHEENIPFFFLFLGRNLFALLALEQYSLTTVLFPLSVSGACFFLLVLVYYRRKVIAVEVIKNP
ncbi:hypothetical protein [Gimesia fumaroli]|jgi:hypothetical protein|uniref:Uncharacterized protein n=1 Tax=Gimesia fumaroli TaxID=2527976 RepID=A0A518IFA8_9PLAN|nr:hypothetical protein [Gimesia fumaroli]QDV51774.1 hypothetical protein Enr17x_38320 [Gimesia fumaroli]